ncbi:hypothetical protein GCM10023091_13450 [Ravibacter arvi]|uniref:BT-3987-like N-terminal domain-containing protein n=1 Tax=Ravibacter arvi TaxID=2051041 RepID=A0ABP8LW88_9BACT
MKNWVKCLLMIAVPGLGGCYDDYIQDYEYTTIYMPYQHDVRTFVVGEGMRIRVGAELGGVRENKEARNANFKIAPELINRENLLLMQASSFPYIKNSMLAVDTLRLMPANFYSLSNDNTIEILPGNHTGTIEIKADSAAFLANTGTLKPAFAIPLELTSVDADRVLDDKKTAVIALKYENMLFGNYLHGGVTTVKDPSGQVVSTAVYRTSVSQNANEVWSLVTESPLSLSVARYSNVASTKPELLLTQEGNRIRVGSATGATFQYEGDGESTFNGVRKLQDRRIFLKYKFLDADGNTHFATDTLTFRNRIRDGVNEWQGNGQ